MSEINHILPIELPMPQIAAFCQRWGIIELALFGSALRHDFGPNSDIDLLVTFAPDADLTPDRNRMRAELEALAGRSVDIMYRRVIERDPDYLLRRHILDTAQVIYAA